MNVSLDEGDHASENVTPLNVPGQRQGKAQTKKELARKKALTLESFTKKVNSK